MLTGKETESPRGRIYLVRSAIEGSMDWDSSVQKHLDTCLGCRACETSCPSGVEYGSILEMAREKLESKNLRPFRERFARRVLLDTITNPNKLRWAIRLGKCVREFVTKCLSPDKQEAIMPIPETGEWSSSVYPIPTRKVYFLQGCAMSVLYSVTNAATIHLLRMHGCEVLIPRNVKCCGALHLHSGNVGSARKFAEQLICSMSEDIPIITNSAGCGSVMKDYPSKRVCKNTKDISEFLIEIGYKPTPRQNIRVTYHDACHLAHGQQIRNEPRELLKATPGVTLVEMDESDRCCGSAGIYNLTQPKLAKELLNRKWERIVETGAEIVVTGNPGCLAWIQQAASESNSKIRVVHTALFLAGG